MSIPLEPVAETVPVPTEAKVRISRQIELTVDPTEVTTSVSVHNPNQVLAGKVFANLKKIIEGKPLTRTNIAELVGATIRMAESLKRGKDPLTGEEKKSIVMYAINQLVHETPMDEELRAYFTEIFIPLMLSGLIDSLCSLQVADIKSWFSCCGGNK